MSEPNLKVPKGCFFVDRELSQEFDMAFDAICSELLDSHEKELAIDLGSAVYISSADIVINAATYFQVSTRGKLLKVGATSEIIKLLQMAGFVGYINFKERISPRHGALPETLQLATMV